MTAATTTIAFMFDDTTYLDVPYSIASHFELIKEFDETDIRDGAIQIDVPPCFSFADVKTLLDFAQLLHERGTFEVNASVPDWVADWARPFDIPSLCHLLEVADYFRFGLACTFITSNIASLIRHLPEHIREDTFAVSSTDDEDIRTPGPHSDPTITASLSTMRSNHFNNMITFLMP